MMQIRLLKPYGVSPPGTILPSVAEPIAALLINRGVGEAVKVVEKRGRKPKEVRDA